ncbi:MAG TPA: aminoacyl-tRNA hydrolase [Ktedonobacterales bacterium]
MKVIAGLGNPGLRYARTRHNAGFDVVDLIAARQNWTWDTRRFHSLMTSGSIGPEKVVLLKPQTFMNDSGLAVSEAVRFYKLDLADLLVICDDLDLPLGKVRLRPNGSAGGQHGLESIIRHLSSNAFPRIKIGVGRPKHGRAENIDFLLSQPRGDERLELDAAIERAAEAALTWVSEGTEVAMNRYNA